MAEREGHLVDFHNVLTGSSTRATVRHAKQFLPPGTRIRHLNVTTAGGLYVAGRHASPRHFVNLRHGPPREFCQRLLFVGEAQRHVAFVVTPHYFKRAAFAGCAGLRAIGGEFTRRLTCVFFRVVPAVF